MAKLIEENIVQALVNYLSTRPYNEVYQILPILTNLPEGKSKENNDAT